MPTRAMFLVMHDPFYNISKPCCCCDKTYNFHTFIHNNHPKLLLHLIVYEDTQINRTGTERYFISYTCTLELITSRTGFL
jgi:hypothetical protein